jgi:hypothetical protein
MKPKRASNRSVFIDEILTFLFSPSKNKAKRLNKRNKRNKTTPVWARHFINGIGYKIGL